LLKNLEAELQQDDRPGIESPSLSSLEVYQIDTSLTDGIEGIHIGSDGGTRNTNETIANNVKRTEVVPDLLLAQSPSPPASADDDSMKPSSSSTPLDESGGHDLLTMALVGNQLFRESLLADREEAPIQKETLATSSENLVPVPDKEESDINQEKTLFATTKVAPNKRTRMLKNLIFLGIGVVLFIGCGTVSIPLNHSKIQLESPTDRHSDKVPLITNIKPKAHIQDTADHNVEEVHTTIVFNIKSKIKQEDTADHNGDEAPIVSSIKSKVQIKDTADQVPLVSTIKPKLQIKDAADHNDDKEPIVAKTSDWGTADAKRDGDGASGYNPVPLDRNAVSIFYSWRVGLVFIVCGLWIFLRPALTSSFSSPKAKPAPKMESSAEANSNSKLESSPKAKSKASMEPTTPTGSSPHRRRGEGSFLTPPPCNDRSMEPTQWMSPCYGENAVDVSVYESMKVVELRKLLRSRNCNYQGTKQQMIKMLIHSYQSELICLSVQKIRPKLRKRRLSQKGTKADVIRRLVESGPI